MRNTHRLRGGCGALNGERALRRAKRDWLDTASDYGIALDNELLEQLLRGLQTRARQQGASLDAIMHANIRRFLDADDQDDR